MPSNHCDDCVFYIDESGDLGFAPGSSRYFVIGVVCVDSDEQKLIKRYVRRFRAKKGLGRKVELHASETKTVDRVHFCQGLARLPCSIHYLVLNKAKIKPELRRDKNILYNFLCGLVLPPLMSVMQQATIHMDCRNIKVASGNSLHDYLRVKLWGEMNASVDVQFGYFDSRESEGIQAADLVANAVYRRYERGDSRAYDSLLPIMGEKKELFF